MTKISVSESILLAVEENQTNIVIKLLPLIQDYYINVILREVIEKDNAVLFKYLLDVKEGTIDVRTYPSGIVDRAIRYNDYHGIG